jgi:hypothetical protein
MARIATLVLAALLPLAAVAAEVGGVKLDDKRIDASGPELVLNGAGIRTRFVVRSTSRPLPRREEGRRRRRDRGRRAEAREHHHAARRRGAAVQRGAGRRLRANNSAADVEKLKGRSTS